MDSAIGKTVEAGLGIKDWNFLAPIYVNDKINCHCILSKSKATKNPQTCVNHWDFEFKNQKDEMVQNLHLLVLHQKQPKS
jgi:acyl dehydratase